MGIWAAVALAAALSLDSLAVGALYGVRAIRIPGRALFVASLCSAGILGAALAAGLTLSRHLSAGFAPAAGAAVLVVVGSISVIRCTGCGARSTAPGPTAGAHAPPRRWRVLGLVLQIRRQPAAADLDRSGSISNSEAALLGLALAGDSIGAGLGAGIAGFPVVLLMALVAVGNWAGLMSGVWMSSRLPFRLPVRWEVVHGLALITLGLYRLV